MRRLILVSFAVLCMGAAVAGAQDVDEDVITHAEFAALLLQAADGFTGELPEPAVALDTVKELELVPADWQADDPLTYGEFADVVGSFGIAYTPGARDDLVTQAYAEAFLRRNLSNLRDYLAKRLGHGFSIHHILDQGVDRAVSPSTF